MFNKKIIYGVVLFAVSMGLVGCENIDYSNAQKMLKNGQYDEAIVAFQTLGDYKDSAEQVKACKYAKAEALYDDGDYLEASEIFSEITDYSDAEEMGNSSLYKLGEKCFSNEKYLDSVEAYRKIGDYKDAKEKKKEAAAALIKQYIDQNGKVINDAKDGLILKSHTDKVYSIDVKEDKIAYVAIEGENILVGSLYETMGAGLYACDGINITLDSSKDEMNFNSVRGMAISLFGKSSTSLCEGYGTIDCASATNLATFKIDKVINADNILNIENTDVVREWKEFYTNVPKVLDKMGLIPGDIGLDSF